MAKGVLKGDLATTPLRSVLTDLAAGVASGCLHVDDGVEESRVYLRGGRVYAVVVPGNRPQLGARLVSSGALGPEALAEALEAQRTELQGWRLGELLVHLGYVDQPVVEAFVDEQVRESMSDLLRWTTATWRFRVNERTREDVAPPVEVADLLDEVDRRRLEWERVVEVVHGPEAVPSLAAGSASPEMDIDADAWSLLCKVDGTRSISELARDCGFTLFEAGQVVYALVEAGLVQVEEVLGAEPEAVPEPLAEPAVAEHESQPAAAAVAEAFADDQAAAELADVVAHELATVAASASAAEHSTASVAALISSALAAPARRTDPRSLADSRPAPVEEVEGSISRVSEALSALLGPGQRGATGDDAFASPPRRKAASPADPEAERKATEKAKRDAKRRERDAAELAAAQADLEMAKLAEEARRADLDANGTDAVVVDLEEVRREAAERDAAEQAAAEQAAAERLAAEQAAAEQAAAEQAEAERLAAEQAAAEQAETERLAAEQAAAEQAAAEQAAAEQAAAEQAAAEQAAAEQAAAEQAAAEQAAAEQAAAEQAAAEQAAAEQAEAERLAAEQAEAERLAAEQAEAERLAAEQAAAEQAARHSSELAAQAAEELRLQQEAAEVAAAEAERERVAAEKAARRAAKEAQRREAEEAAAVEIAAAAAVDPSAQAALYAELSMTADSATEAQAPAAAVAVAEVDDEPMPSYAPNDTDTASLLRELSSLGFDEDPAPPSRPATPPRPVAPAAAASKKRKGLFGR